ncbi:hypothetical protein BGZ59_010740 [Podila verticillata]|nr:hypothetical protein BGZ59_010740 [Podila verticillata]
MGASQYFAIGTLQGFSTKTKKAYENSGRIANEAIMNIRTVVLLARTNEDIEGSKSDVAMNAWLPQAS